MVERETSREASSMERDRGTRKNMDVDYNQDCAGAPEKAEGQS